MLEQPEFRCLEINVPDYFEPLDATAAWAVYRYIDSNYRRVGEIGRIATRLWAAYGNGKTWCLQAPTRARAIERAAAEGNWECSTTT